MSEQTKISGYKIDFAKQCLYMNYKFARAASEYGSSEYKLLQDILKDNPSLRPIVRAGRETKTPNQFKRLTYKNMESYIRVQDNAEELLAAFAIAKEESKKEKSPYKYVRGWFAEQFPNCWDCKVFDDGKIIQLETASQNAHAS